MTGMVNVEVKVNVRKTRAARNFPMTSSQAFMGKVRSISQVFSFRSSAQMRIVTAGMNTAKRIGRFAKKGRMSATGNMKKEVMNRPTLIVTKTMMKI